MSARELLPCPFCGGEARVRSYRTSEDSMGTLVGCLSCFAETDEIDAPYAEHAQAVAMWNRRVSVSTSAPKETSEPDVRYERKSFTFTFPSADQYQRWCEAGGWEGRASMKDFGGVLTPEPAEPREEGSK